MFGTSSFRPTSGPRRLLPAVVAFALVLSACGSEDDLGGEVVDDGLGCQLSEVDRRDDAPVVEAGLKVEESTTFEDLDKPDDEACLVDGQRYLTLDLVGATADDATVFSDTFAEAKPITARLGQGQLLAGLETGLAGMGVGARRQVVIPAAEAYGPDGNEAQGIGPDEDLVFVVDLVALSDTPMFCNDATNIPEGTRDGKPTDIAVPDDPPTEVKTTVLEEGDGPEATSKSYVTVDYVAVSCGTGQQFDSSWDREEPITVALADAEPTATAQPVIPGWTKGLEGQQQGSLVQIDIPYQEAYGAAGRPPAIGPSDPLTFVVRIVEVADEAPPDPTTTTTATDGGG
jgi:FKBP-type peptidyl-prolyl cis-trans isomerase